MPGVTLFCLLVQPVTNHLGVVTTPLRKMRVKLWVTVTTYMICYVWEDKCQYLYEVVLVVMEKSVLHPKKLDHGWISFRWRCIVDTSQTHCNSMHCKLLSKILSLMIHLTYDGSKTKQLHKAAGASCSAWQRCRHDSFDLRWVWD